MKNELHSSVYIDRYLDNVMSEEEKIWFEKELEDNIELQEDLSLYRSVNDVLEDTDTLKLKLQLDQIHDQQFGKKTIGIKPHQLRRLAYGTSLAASVAISVFIAGKTKSKSTPAELYAQYFEPAEMNMSFRAGNLSDNHELRLAMQYYDSKEYRKAIGLFEKIIALDNSRIGLNLYSGISHMEIEEYEEANRRFQKIIDYKANAFVESAEWYRALCYLRMREDAQARLALEKIIESKGYYSAEAKRLLKKLN